jgi:hypothetical protein
MLLLVTAACVLAQPAFIPPNITVLFSSRTTTTPPTMGWRATQRCTHQQSTGWLAREYGL